MDKPKPLDDGWLSEQAIDDMVDRMSPDDRWGHMYPTHTDPVSNDLLRKELREVAAAALEWAESTVPHEPGCPTICDDESDYEFLSDAGECVCQRRVFVETMRAKAKEIRDGA